MINKTVGQRESHTCACLSHRWMDATRVCMYSRTYVQPPLCVHIHIYTYTHIHIHIHTYTHRSAVCVRTSVGKSSRVECSGYVCGSMDARWVKTEKRIGSIDRLHCLVMVLVNYSGETEHPAHRQHSIRRSLSCLLTIASVSVHVRSEYGARHIQDRASPSPTVR